MKRTILMGEGLTDHIWTPEELLTFKVQFNDRHTRPTIQSEYL